VLPLIDHPFELVVGFIVGVVLGGPLIGWTNYIKRGQSRGGKWFTAEMGLVERTIFWIAFLIGRWEIAAAWVALKIGSKWGAWSNQPGVFNLFATGVGLSLLYAGAGAFLVRAIVDRDIPSMLVLLFGPFLLNAAVLLLDAPAIPIRVRRWFDPEADREGNPAPPEP
jgi:hypothetical protein